MLHSFNEYKSETLTSIRLPQVEFSQILQLDASPVSFEAWPLDQSLRLLSLLASEQLLLHEWTDYVLEEQLCEVGSWDYEWNLAEPVANP